VAQTAGRLGGILDATPRRAAALARISHRTSWQRICLARAKSCLAAADQVAEVGPPLRAAGIDPRVESLGLVRSACLWLLALEIEGPRSIDDVIASPRALARIEEVGERHRWEIVSAILRRTQFGDAALSSLEADGDRAQLASLGGKLLALHETPERELRRARRSFVVRLALLGAMFLAALVVGATRLAPLLLGPDLAAGKPWKTSSSLATCDPAHASCGGRVTVILFHTVEEDSPWFEIDLTAPKQVHRVEVRNRLDCCEDRAVPLVVEVSLDETTWTTVARREEVFARWTASFAPTQARYVRLRVPRKTFLHLEEVVVR